jgi:hypothetical protein
MPVIVMHIGRVRVRVRQDLVQVPVGVRLARRILRAVRMLVMFVVGVGMGMHRPVMGMRMVVAFGEV